MSVITDTPSSHLLPIWPLASNFPRSTMMSTESGSERRLSSANEGGTFTPAALIIRKLPKNTTTEALKTMLLFAQDFQDAELITNEHTEDTGFVTAVVRFSTTAGALEAQALLDGKPNTAGQANMIVEMASHGSINGARRKTMETAPTRNTMQHMSPPPVQMPKSSRFNGTFQSIEKLSPPLISSPPDQLTSASQTMQTIFSPHSPNQLKDGSRVSGKSVIGEDNADDETGKLLNDPLAYMKNDSAGYFTNSRTQNNHRIPVGAFGALSLNTNMSSTTSPSFTSPRSALHANTPNSAFSPGGNGYQAGGNHFLRHNYPPANPADQNPPCNTLYVGNLPMDTSEDELKAMFSKQRGYKRLCFRTKQNGPMCFVEFEDISFATKALNELYGAQLHNSVKGGIRLSFSKNPLGVRSGQPGGNNPTSPLSPGSSMLNGMQPLSPGAFATANGPPPGLSAPPGLHVTNSMSPTMSNGHFQHAVFPLGMSPLPGGRGVPMGNGTTGSQNGLPDYMMGR